MLNISWKAQLSSGLAAIALVCIGSPAQAQATNLPLAKQLADIAFGYAQAQQPEKAIALLEQAQTYVGKDCFEAIAWLKIGVAYQAAGDQDQGEKFLTKAADSATERTSGNCYSSATSPTESVLNRATEYAEAGHLDLALQIATRVDSFFAPLTLAKIAGEYAEAGQPREAKRILTQTIASYQALVAQEKLDNVPGLDADNIPVLMAYQLSQSGQLELAKFVVEQSGLVPTKLPEPTQPSETTASNITHYLFIARLLADLGQSQQALPLLDSIVLNIQPSAEYPLEETLNWVEAAQIYHLLNSSSQANKALEQAQTRLAQLSKTQTLPSAQAAIVRGYAGIGEFDQALALAKSVADVSQRQIAYSAIATAYAKAGLSAEADSLVQSIGNPQFSRVDMLHAYLETKQYAQAEQVAQQPDMIEFLPAVGSAYCEAGLPEKVVPLIDQSPSKDWLRECAATEFATQGEFERASALAQTIEVPETKAEALTQIAVQYNNPTDNSRWQRLWERFSNLWQRQSDVSRSEPVAKLLDQAVSLIQPKK